MNRFEALHTLGLEDGATDDEIRLAYYGIERSIEPNEFADIESVRRSAAGLLDRAKQSRDYLLDLNANKTAAQMVVERAVGRKKKPKLSITAEQDKRARLNGLEKMRLIAVSHLDSQRTARNMSILAIVICIIVSFVVLRYIRAMQPRVLIFTVIAIVAVVASTILTTSLMGVRKSKAHVVALDERIDDLKRKLGIITDEEDASEDAGAAKEGTDSAVPLLSDSTDDDQAAADVDGTTDVEA